MTRPPEDHALVGYALAGMGGLVALWALFWPIPTEVVGKGVLIYPDQAGLLDSRAAGQVRRLKVRVGDRVSRGQVLMEKGTLTRPGEAELRAKCVERAAKLWKRIR